MASGAPSRARDEAITNSTPMLPTLLYERKEITAYLR